MSIINGTYNKTIFRNRETGYTSFVFDLSQYDQNGEKRYICKGNIPNYVSGIPLVLEGKLETRGNDTFFFVNSSDYDISTKRLSISFIKAHLPLGLGNKAAEDIQKLLDSVNLNINEFIVKDNVQELLQTIKGFSKAKSIQFINKTKEDLVKKEVYDSLAKYGIRYNQVDTLCETLGSNTKNVLKNNPYKTLSNVGVSFDKIDLFAKEHGYDVCFKERILSLLKKTSEGICQLGHTFINANALINLFRIIERKNSAYDECIPESLVYLYLSDCPSLIYKENRIYNKYAELTEHKIVKHLKRLKDTSEKWINQETIEKCKTKTTLDDSQKCIFDFLSDSEPCILIGGPGTGKTTTIKDLLNCFKLYLPQKTFALCAPTGRAAQRLKESSKEEAKTINLLLESSFINGDKAVPLRNETNPLDADLIIVDEFSMTGLFLFNDLLSAMKNGSKLIVVGDWNQLQSVEPGALLHDMVSSKCFKTLRLTQTHRQSNDNAIDINVKKMLVGNNDFVIDSQFQIVNCNNNEEGRLVLKDLFLKEFDKNDIGNTLVMSPERKNECGTESLNVMLQESLHTTDEPYITFENNIFFENDRIMTIKNVYDSHKFYNGDLWKVNAVIDDNQLQIEGLDERTDILSDEYLDMIELAYAMTVHKCQGSEADSCIVFLPSGISSRLISKSLLYTAISRAKKKLVIINVDNTLSRFLNAPFMEKRNSNITLLLKEAFL